MHIVDRLSRSFAANKEIPTFGMNHLLLSLIPVISLVVERGMFMRGDDELVAKRKLGVRRNGEDFIFKDLSTCGAFMKERDSKFYKIAAWHLITGLFQGIPWAMMFGMSPLPKGCFAVLYASHMMVYIQSDSLSFSVKAADN